MDELQSLHNQLVTPDGHCALMRIWPTLMPIWPTLMRIWPTLMRIWAEDNVLHRGIQVYKQLHYGVGSMAGTMGTVGTMGTMAGTLGTVAAALWCIVYKQLHYGVGCLPSPLYI